ncbi:hypothetical protein BC826DRAFT_1041440 [Russula brevipes]|nr:hypothetical protein BC826DRAFT_1041440 [Russula brevipes]
MILCDKCTCAVCLSPCLGLPSTPVRRPSPLPLASPCLTVACDHENVTYVNSSHDSRVRVPRAPRRAPHTHQAINDCTPRALHVQYPITVRGPAEHCIQSCSTLKHAQHGTRDSSRLTHQTGLVRPHLSQW